MTDWPDLPAFLDRKIDPESWAQVRRDWRPMVVCSAGGPMVGENRDSANRALPRNMTPEAWALLHSLERRGLL